MAPDAPDGPNGLLAQLKVYQNLSALTLSTCTSLRQQIDVLQAQLKHQESVKMGHDLKILDLYVQLRREQQDTASTSVSHSNADRHDRADRRDYEETYIDRADALYRTRPCVFFNQRRGCGRGDRCTYIHCCLACSSTHHAVYDCPL